MDSFIDGYVELVDYIFGYFTMVEVIVGMFVCKKWKELLTGKYPVRDTKTFLEREAGQITFSVFRWAVRYDAVTPGCVTYKAVQANNVQFIRELLISKSIMIRPLFRGIDGVDNGMDDDRDNDKCFTVPENIINAAIASRNVVMMELIAAAGARLVYDSFYAVGLSGNEEIFSWLAGRLNNNIQIDRINELLEGTAKSGNIGLFNFAMRSAGLTLDMMPVSLMTNLISSSSWKGRLAYLQQFEKYIEDSDQFKNAATVHAFRQCHLHVLQYLASKNLTRLDQDEVIIGEIFNQIVRRKAVGVAEFCFSSGLFAFNMAWKFIKYSAILNETAILQYMGYEVLLGCRADVIGDIFQNDSVDVFKYFIESSKITKPIKWIYEIISKGAVKCLKVCLDVLEDSYPDDIQRTIGILTDQVHKLFTDGRFPEKKRDAYFEMFSLVNNHRYCPDKIFMGKYYDAELVKLLFKNRSLSLGSYVDKPDIFHRLHKYYITYDLEICAADVKRIVMGMSYEDVVRIFAVTKVEINWEIPISITISETLTLDEKLELLEMYSEKLPTVKWNLALMKHLLALDDIRVMELAKKINVKWNYQARYKFGPSMKKWLANSENKKTQLHKWITENTTKARKFLNEKYKRMKKRKAAEQLDQGPRRRN